MNRVEEHTFKKNGWLGGEKHHGSRQFSFIALETELQCHGVVPSTYLLKRHGFSRFCHHPDGISAFFWSFFPHEMKQHGLTAWLASLSGSALSLSLYLSFFVDVLFASISKILQKHPTRIQKKHTHELILPTFFLSRTIFTSLLVTLLPQQRGHFFQHPRAMIKTLLWMKLLPTEMGIMLMLLHCYYYLLCDLLLRWLSDHFKRLLVPLPSTSGIKPRNKSASQLETNLTW